MSTEDLGYFPAVHVRRHFEMLRVRLQRFMYQPYLLILFCRLTFFKLTKTNIPGTSNKEEIQGFSKLFKRSTFYTTGRDHFRNMHLSLPRASAIDLFLHKYVGCFMMYWAAS